MTIRSVLKLPEIAWPSPFKASGPWLECETKYTYRCTRHSFLSSLTITPFLPSFIFFGKSNTLLCIYKKKIYNNCSRNAIKQRYIYLNTYRIRKPRCSSDFEFLRDKERNENLNVFYDYLYLDHTRNRVCRSGIDATNCWRPGISIYIRSYPECSFSQPRWVNWLPSDSKLQGEVNLSRKLVQFIKIYYFFLVNV